MLHGWEPVYPVFRDAVARLAAAGLVIDLGTPSRFHKEIRPFAGWFARYRAMGYRDHDRVDFAGDIQALPVRTGSVDGVLALSVLEHVPAPWRAVEEMRRVVRPGGLAVVTVPFQHPYHAAPTFGDYYRFTRTALQSLFTGWRAVTVTPLGGTAYRLSQTLRPVRLQQLVTGSKPGQAVIRALDRPSENAIGFLVVAEA